MNIYEIAAEAGVSISTISRVINSPEKVSPKTRKRVEDAFVRNNYVPNALARSLVKSSSKNVGIISSEIRNLYYATAAHVLEDCFFKWGYTSFLCPTGGSLGRKLEYVRILAEKQVDGLVLVGSAFSVPEIEASVQKYLSGTPIIAINGWLSAADAHTVSVDHAAGAELILDHLTERGYKNIYFACCTRNQNSAKKKEALSSAIRRRGLPMNAQENIFQLEPGYDAVHAFAEEFLPLARQHSAVIFSNDISAGYGLLAFRELGLSVPRDVGIVGYDNICYPNLHFPDVTVLDTKIELLSSLAANTLHDIFIQRDVGRGISIPPELIVRSST
ncbi:Catabolite control protein A [bioreactor metagenome]|uniref:Catabolite control protein A n=1 Tax=bioreactor metagenome TaxID=1076179 RepID=A0A644Y8H1_9ZZZZ|nr:LacI family DNA-binding transcriptional regulator [Oscillibacter sp.]MEA4992396.1 LacI family DNA-binding transcriptional regulator [Oscillibacter sp.]